MKTKVLFTVGHNIAGEIVEFVTHSNWAHASIFMLDGIVEAVSPVAKISDVNIYNDINHEIIEILIPNIEDAIAEAKALIGRPYGLFTDCVDGGLYDVLKIQLAGNGERTVNCSELVTRILRAGGVDILPGVPADCVTPQDLYIALLLLINSELN